MRVYSYVRYIDEFGRERRVADAPPPASALRIDSSSVKNTLEALKSSSSSSSAISSLLSSADGAGAGRDDMRARVAKNMPADGSRSEQNCESCGHPGQTIVCMSLLLLYYYV